MSETHTGLNGRSNDKGKDNPQQLQRESGTRQRQPQPNENLANQPYSNPAALNPDLQRHHWNDTDPEETESAGVTQGHADPQRPKHGHGAEGSGSTGLPQGEDGQNPSGDRNPRTQEGSHESRPAATGGSRRP